MRTDPTHVSSRINLGVLLARQSRLDEAIAILAEATSVDPDSAEAWGNLSRAEELAGRVDDAVASAERAVNASRGRDLWALERLEGAWLRAGRIDEATRTAQRALERARATGEDDLVAKIESRLQRYATRSGVSAGASLR